MKNNKIEIETPDILESEFSSIIRKTRIDKNKLRGKKILVTGANGFLGQYIIGSLSLASIKMKLGCKIIGVSANKPKNVLSSILKRDKNVSFLKVDLTKKFNLAGFDYIFHAAGYGQPAKFLNNPLSTVIINTSATNNLIKSSPNSTFVFFSSSEVYGNVPKEQIPVSENYNGNISLHNPRSVYAESKRLGESICSSYSNDNHHKIKIVRISPTYGPGLPKDDRRVMSDFIRKGLSGKTIDMLDNGASIKTYGYISDTIEMILFVTFHGKEMVYNLGGQNSVSILELVKKISKYCNVDYKTGNNVDKKALLTIDQKIIKLNLRKIKKEMKNFKFTNFTEGLYKTIEWTREQKI